MEFTTITDKYGIKVEVPYSDNYQVIKIHTLIFIFDKEAEEVIIYKNDEGIDMQYLGSFDTEHFNELLCKDWIKEKVSIEL